jgi:hypothetical protein
MPSLARNLAEGTGGGGNQYTLPTALHALTVDDGMLVYTKALYGGSGTENVEADLNLAASDTTFFTMFENYIDDYNDTTGQGLNTTRYDQWYNGSKDVFYYIDDEGYFCMRTNKPYTYTEPK